MEAQTSILITAGLLAGVVNFFIIYAKLPVVAAFAEEAEDVPLRDIWWFALLGYILVGIAGAFLMPLLNSALGGLKGLEAVDKNGKLTYDPNYSYILFGYGIVTGFSANKVLGSLTKFLSDRIDALERKANRLALAPQFSQRQALAKTSLDIFKACSKHFEAFKMDCSGFVKAVCGEYGVTLTGQADDIVDQLVAEGWNVTQSGLEAKRLAESGYLVIGGLKSANHQPPKIHGHLVIVTPGPIAQEKYPTAYWGSLNSVGKKGETVNWAWNRHDRDLVQYFSKEI